MVSDMADWKWSSYPAMIGDVSATAWVEKDWILSHFGKSRPSAILNYKNFVREGIGLPSIHQGIKGKAIMGDEEFVADALTKIKTAAEAGDLKEVPRMQRRAQAKPLSWYKENFLSRDEGIVSAYRSRDHTMKLIADKFKVHYSTVSRAIKKAEMHDCMIANRVEGSITN
jgi:putative transposase